METGVGSDLAAQFNDPQLNTVVKRKGSDSPSFKLYKVLHRVYASMTLSTSNKMHNSSFLGTIMGKVISRFHLLRPKEYYIKTVKNPPNESCS